MCRRCQGFETFLNLYKAFETSVLIFYVDKMVKFPKAEFDKMHQRRKRKFRKHKGLFQSVQELNLEQKTLFKLQMSKISKKAFRNNNICFQHIYALILIVNTGLS